MDGNDDFQPSVVSRRVPLPRTINPGNMRLRNQRDNQQWILDYLVKVTGRDRHFFYDGRKFPAETRSYAMIPHQTARVAGHAEALAAAAEARGHNQTALRLYHKAAMGYLSGIQALPFDDHPERIYLHEKLIDCFEKVISLADTRIERFEVDWEHGRLPGLFYSCGVPGAPTVFHVNGSDSMKELFPDALDNAYVARGCNVAVVDGPGQGEAIMRKIRITPENFAPAMIAAVDQVLKRPEVSPDRLVGSGFSFGAFFILKIAAREPRFKAVATGAGSYGSPYAMWHQESPHFRRQFMYMTGIMDDSEFDVVAEKFVLTAPELANITCPVLMLHGEYDPMNPLEDAMRVYEGLAGPKEFWITENDGHSAGTYSHFGGLRALDAMADWINDIFRGRLPPQEGLLKVIGERGQGPYGSPAAGFWMPDRFEQA